MKLLKASAFFLLLAGVSCGSESLAARVVFPEAGDRSVQVEIADTPEKHALGLMFRDWLADGHGMWFVFQTETDMVFWMKNVRFPIDIIFIDKEFSIRTIWKSVPPCPAEPCPRYPSGAPAQYVLETQSGFCEKYGIRENQKVRFKR